jgi:hypothetical protein
MTKHKPFSDIDVRANLKRYLDGGEKDMGRHPDGRYASFDYCFNYFQSFRKHCIRDICSPDNIQQSCLQLGFYLASWGMLRGSTFLLWRSARFYQAVLKTIADADKRLWDVDVDSYMEDQTIRLLLDARNAIRDALGRTNRASDTLVTKIMLGVYGNVPAFDQYFCTGLGVGKTFNKENLMRVAEFYEWHNDVIDAQRIYTIDFRTGNKTQRYYPKVKIVDMVLVMQGP